MLHGSARNEARAGRRGALSNARTHHDCINELLAEAPGPSLPRCPDHVGGSFGVRDVLIGASPRAQAGSSHPVPRRTCRPEKPRGSPMVRTASVVILQGGTQRTAPRIRLGDPFMASPPRDPDGTCSITHHRHLQSGPNWQARVRTGSRPGIRLCVEVTHTARKPACRNITRLAAVLMHVLARA